jgi:hypothetical protein
MADLYENSVRQFNQYLTQELGLENPQYGKFWQAAIWGNGGEESIGFTQMHQKGGNGRGGWQWDDRRPAYETFCSQNGVDPDTVAASVWFLVHELKGKEAHSLEQLKKTTTLEAATYTFMKLFERPGVEAEPVRLRWAQRALNIITEMENKPVIDTPNPTPPMTTAAPAVDQLAQIIKTAELTVEQVLRAFLVAKGVPGFLIDFVFAQVNNIPFADLIRNLVNQFEKK